MCAIRNLGVDRDTWVEISATMEREVMGATAVAMVMFLGTDPEEMMMM